MQFSLLLVPHSLQPHGLQHTRLPCPSPTPRACSNSCPLVIDAIQSHLRGWDFIPCHPLLLLPSIFPSIKVFSNESVLLVRWPKYWILSFSTSTSNKYSGLISIRVDGLHQLAVQETIKSPIYHHSSKASILQHSAFFMAQLSHPYMTIGKTIPFTR